MKKEVLTAWAVHNTSNITLSDNNKTATVKQGAHWSLVCGPEAWNSGLHKFEVLIGTAAYYTVGVIPENTVTHVPSTTGSHFPGYGNFAGGCGIHSVNGHVYCNNTPAVFSQEYGNATRLGVKVDFSSQKVEFFKNGTSLGVFPSYSLTLHQPLRPAVALYGNGAVTVVSPSFN